MSNNENKPGLKGYTYTDMESTSDSHKFIVLSETSDNQGTVLTGRLLYNSESAGQSGTPLTAELFNNLENRLGRVEDTESNLLDRTITLETQVSTNATNINTLTGSVSETEKRTEALETNVGANNQAISELKATVNGTEETTGVVSRVNALENTINNSTTGLVKRVTHLEDIYDSCDKRIKAIEELNNGASLTALSETVENHSDQLEELGMKVDSLVASGGTGSGNSMTQAEFDNMLSYSDQYSGIMMDIDAVEEKTSTIPLIYNAVYDISPYDFEENRPGYYVFSNLSAFNRPPVVGDKCSIFGISDPFNGTNMIKKVYACCTITSVSSTDAGFIIDKIIDLDNIECQKSIDTLTARIEALEKSIEDISPLSNFTMAYKRKFNFNGRSVAFKSGYYNSPDGNFATYKIEFANGYYLHGEAYPQIITINIYNPYGRCYEVEKEGCPITHVFRDGTYDIGSDCSVTKFYVNDLEVSAEEFEESIILEISVEE